MRRRGRARVVLTAALTMAGWAPALRAMQAAEPCDVPGAGVCERGRMSAVAITATSIDPYRPLDRLVRKAGSGVVRDAVVRLVPTNAQVVIAAQYPSVMVQEGSVLEADAPVNPGNSGGPSQSADPMLFLPPAEVSAEAPLVLVLSGDGDWAPFPRRLAEELNRRGVPVIGLKSRSYLSHPRLPDEAAALLAGAVRTGMERWGARAIVVIGYSRGAGMAPFVVNSWPDELHQRVRAIAFVGLGERASFEFHLTDLIRDNRRQSDLPTRPQLERLAGVSLICVVGIDERDSLCDRPVAGMRVFSHRGGHRVGGDSEVIELLLNELAVPPRRAAPPP